MDKKELFELTNPQKSIWYMEEFYKGTTINNICGSLTINEKVDFEKFEQAIRCFVSQNKSFSIKLKIDGDTPKQYFSDSNNFSIDYVDINSKEEIQNIETEMVNTPFDTIDSLLFEFKIFRFKNGHGGFVVNCHHLIADACTFALIGNNIAKIYYNLLNNIEEKYEFPSYLDYIDSEKTYLLSDKFKKDEEYWNNQFSTIPDIASIPASFRDKSSYSSNSKREAFVLSKDIIDKIRDFCAKEKISVFNFFMAIYSLYISRVSNTDEVVIGTPILNRTNFKEKNTCGMFISNVPLKICVDNNLSFVDFVSNIAKDSLSMLRHQKYPYQYLLENLRKQNTSVSNLYDNMISYQITKANDGSVDLPYEVHWTGANHISCGINIHLHDNNDSGSLIMAYDYLVDKYSLDDVCSTHNRILTMINQVLNADSILLNDIEIVTPEEKNKILFEFNNTAVDYPKDKTIVDLFEEQVEKNPDNVAVVFENQKLTYRELNEKANQLANLLIEKDISLGKLVAVYLEKDINYIISILAILKTGAAFIPVSTSYPIDRISYMLENSKSDILITTNDLYKELNVNIKYLNILSNEYSSYSNKNINMNYDSNNLAYVLYTSGSTGLPKGVMINNYSIINHVFAINKNFDNAITCNDICLSIANISFDANIQEIFIPLLLGASLHLLKNDAIYNVINLANYIYDNKITFSFIPPSILDDICNLLKNKPNCLNKLLVGVESINSQTLNNYLSMNPDFKIHNGYGPTEATICCISYMYKKIDKNCIIPIGKPFSNTKALILHPRTKKLQPVGIPGELFILGDCLSTGYIYNDNLTKNSFGNDLEYTTDSYYRTGDFAYYLPDGNIMFIGRIDSQIKLNGHRIELNEINSNILSFSSIIKCVTILKKKQLISFITANEDINLSELKENLSKKLPRYMLPNQIVQLPSIPTTTNGKIDYKTLENISFVNNEIIIKPSNDTEIKLYEIVKKLLYIDNFSITNNLFNLGMDSLITIKLSVKIHDLFNINIPVSEIFSNPTVQALSKIILDKCLNKNTIIPVAPLSDIYPTSSAQKRIYSSSYISNENSITYNMPGGIILEKVPDIENLEKCFNTIIQKHESLRTYFDLVDGNVVQKIVDEIDFKLNVSSANYKDLDNCFNKFLKPFDLKKAPLFRAELIKFENDKCLLLFDMHHIISDGTSLEILINDLCALYNNKSISNQTLTYKDFAVWEHDNLENNNFDDSKNYWLDMYNEEIPILNLPTNYTRPAEKSFKGSKIYKTINEDLTQKIQELANKSGTTPYMILLAAYYILLSKYSAQDDIVVGSPIIGRDNSQLLDIIGMFVNTLPLRAKINQENSFSEFLQNIKTMCLDSFEHQSYPIDALINDLKIPRDSSRNPLFDVLFTYQNINIKNLKLGNIKSKYYIPDTKISKFDLSLEIVPNDNILDLNFEYCTDLFTNDFIDNLSKHYLNILETIMENVDIPISKITMMSNEEKDKILNEFNNTTTDYPKNSNIVSLFEEQVQKNPNGTAVVFEDQKLTYEELNTKANQLAFAIKNQGIDEGNIVALLMDKSLEMIVSILAVLKANCAFLPIDISYPNERIDYMLKDSNSKLLITTDNSFNSIHYAIKMMTIDISKPGIFSSEYINNYTTDYSPKKLAYIMYTSGSTGNPKGVMVRQKSIIRLVKNSNFIKYNSQEHILQSGSIVFDASTFEIWSALLNGFELYIIKKEDLLNADTLQNYLIKNKITILWLTAPLFNQLVEENPHMFSTVNYLLTGGDVLSPKHINMAKTANPDLNIINGYGPTENTTFSTCFTIDKIYEDNIPIGYPIANSTCYVCSSTGELVPIGVPGELYVGGDGLAIGYLNNPSLNNEKFINFSYTNEKVYKTGDLVRWLPDGSLEFLGRIDSQIKIRGFRVELNEINLRISKYFGIKECTTVLQQINNEKIICCYYVSKENIDLNNLKTYLKTFLPSYMIPSYFIKMDKIPINTNGKVDKKALPTNFNRQNSSSHLEKPKNKTEKLIIDIYKEILNIEELSTTDDFFEIGGDSLSAMKLQVEFMANNLDITYADLFKYSSVKSLSDFINSNHEKEHQEFMDYKKYDKLLKNNSIDVLNKKDNIETTSIGNVFLTGFTGFLGAHVLDSFIKNTDTNIYCLIRGKNNLSALDRLKNILHFYFEDKYDKYIGNRINLVEGDISKDNIGLLPDVYEKLGSNVNTVIHCAAVVKHYGTYNEFEKINVLGTKRIIDFCNKFNLKLLHVSTISVSGNVFAEESYVEHNFEGDVNYDETNFYIGQNLDNLYVKSKFMAEKIVLDAISNGLNACILRMGNLTSRFSEGKFQQNHFENAFVNRFKSILQIKYAPDYLLSGYVEFTPIDFCGDAIIKLATHFNKNFTVFHLLNEKVVTMDRLLSILKDLNIDINIVSNEKFKEIIDNLLYDSDKKSYLEGIINDFNKDKELVYESPIKIKSDFTKEFFKKIGFSWPYIDKNYIYNYLKYLSDIGYFNINLN